MKKLLLLLACALMLSSYAFAWDPIPLSVYGDDNSPVGHDRPRNPIEVPLVYIEDYTLLFEANHPDYILYIKDEYDDVVYSTAVYSAQTQVVLPSTLSGDYKVELVMGDWLFTGWINL